MKQEYLDAKLERYRQKEIYPFHMPGHKRKEHALMDPYSMDITEIEGFDNLHEPEGILLEGKERLAELYGAKESFFLVNGSTCGLLAAISAATRRGDTILMARNCHKAVYHAVELSELNKRRDTGQHPSKRCRRGIEKASRDQSGHPYLANL